MTDTAGNTKASSPADSSRVAVHPLVKDPDWKRLATNIMIVVAGQLQKLSDEELGQVAKLPGLATEDNCWWAVHEARNLLANMAGNESVLRRKTGGGCT